MQIQIPATEETLEQVRGFIEEFVKARDLTEEALFRLNIAVEELLVNVLMHGMKPETDSKLITIELMLAEKDGEVTAEFRDDAPAFNPLEVPPPSLDQPLEEREVGGLGIFLLKELMHCIEYDYKNGQNVVAMTISPKQAPAE